MRRVLVADHHPMVLSALADLIAETPGLELVATAATAGEALGAAHGMCPDLVLIDVDSPGFGGGRLADVLSEMLPGAQVVRLSVLRCPVPLDIEEVLRSFPANASPLELR
jgi:DNA-binding NarL/FixJ family response regulator